MTRHVVTLNAGSSSVKFSFYEADGTLHALAVGQVEMRGDNRHIVVRDATGAVMHEVGWPADPEKGFHQDALQRVLAWRKATFPDAHVVAAGHRVGHGGVRYEAPVLVTDAVLAELEKLVPLAPLHQPHNIAGILAAREAWPHVQQVACFDTAFHRAHPFVNDVFALPRRYYEQGVRRYGFHGLSYEYITGRLRELEPLYAQGRVVVAHLGNGASMCAIRDGLSVASSMGFTPLDGLPMGTRCGQVDPGVLLFMMAQEQMGADAIRDLLYKDSGLKGLSGISHDMRELEASHLPEAAEAIEYFVFRIRRELGGLAAVLKGLDAMVFCGGIGEHAWRVRERVLEGMEWIGIELDRTANRENASIISTQRSRVRVMIIPTDEEAMIVRHTLRVLDREAGAAA
ncbi:Acetate kinase [Rhodovastum atsumiense]|uniref:Acetate kinase n=1 Tax=Rhodovastum atsumiense TaxID=504468 RepID=A0A5M6IMB4_9PROT|nr:acetate/propionate family kinase [Rhodovastum atsumiense]KAA5608695.1 acetate/propionate family kinase [Rhodovastum atsumiense]CAH2599108.1 Acetate kinase [Rhodovastum atsumiense]